MKMFKKIFVILMLFIPLTINAEDNIQNEKSIEEGFVTIVNDEVKTESDVNGSSILAGNNVIATNYVNGINMLFGNSVDYQGNSEYALFAGNIVNLKGNIKNDGFVFGNVITFSDTFKTERDLIVFGSSVVVSGNINRNVKIYASNVVFENTLINGNATVYATSIEIKENVQINSTLSYNEDAETNIEESALINSVEKLDSLNKEATLKEKLYNFIVDYAGILIVFLVVALVVPKLFERIERKYENLTPFDAVSSIGYGALLLVLVPIIFILLLTFVIGIPLAILLLIIYIICVWLSTIFTGYLIGSFIWKKFINKEINVLLAGLIGISTIYILQIIPKLGFGISVISMMLGLGVIFKLFKKD